MDGYKNIGTLADYSTEEINAMRASGQDVRIVLNPAAQQESNDFRAFCQANPDSEEAKMLIALGIKL